MQRGLESTPTVKDVHSPVGQPFVAPVSFADLPDCPVCRYGTPTLRKDRWVCIDCNWDVTERMPARGEDRNRLLTFANPQCNLNQ